jgi:glycosyltransferase involved in cell wall biosynthesis
MPTVSVIIPTYNRARYIGEAVESVLEQESAGCEVEVIVVDDGSTDNTREVLERYGDRIVYRRIENSARPAVPRNLGIGLAKGELIAFQDSDDRWAPDKLRRQLSVFADPEVMLSYGNAATMSQDGVAGADVVVPEADMRDGLVFDDLLASNFISTLTVIVRREMFERAGGFDESMALRGLEDYQLWLRMATVGKFKGVPAVLAHYRQHDDNISRVPEVMAYQRQINTYESLRRLRLSAMQRRRWHDRLAGLYRAKAALPEGGGTADRVRALRHRVAAKGIGLTLKMERQ